MNWLHAVVVGGLNGVFGLVCAGLFAGLCVKWYRISSFEGEAGYFVVGIALLGGIAGLAIGIAAAVWAAKGAGGSTEGGAGFIRTLGYALATMLVISGLATAICWMRADLSPTLNGRYLELAFEVCGAQGFTVPQEQGEYEPFAVIYLPGGRRLPQGALDFAEARQESDRWIVPGTVPLTTSASHKYLRVYFSEEYDELFSLPLQSHPDAQDMEWSGWREGGWDEGPPEPPPEEKFTVRYRVQTIEPPPPEPDQDQVDAARFAALRPDSPLEEWLAFLGGENPPERRSAVLRVAGERPAELARLIESTNSSHRGLALAAAAELPTTPSEVGAAVVAEGREIVEALRRFNGMKPDEPSYLEIQVELRTRFLCWRPAWWTVHRRLGLDGRPPVQEIYDLAKVHARETTLDDIVMNAKAILDALPPAGTPGK